jgi:hypothetical protein
MRDYSYSFIKFSVTVTLVCNRSYFLSRTLLINWLDRTTQQSVPTIGQILLFFPEKKKRNTDHLLDFSHQIDKRRCSRQDAETLLVYIRTFNPNLRKCLIYPHTHVLLVSVYYD